MVKNLTDLPWYFLTVYAIAVGWHFGYVISMVLGAIQEVFGDRKVWKVYNSRLDKAQEKLKNAKSAQGIHDALTDFTDVLAEERNHKREVPRFKDITMWMWWAEVHVAFPTLNFFWIITAHSALDYVLAAVNVIVNYLWWKYHDHDDRWKKKRKKALAKVQEVGGKLVVVPVPSPT